VSDVVYYEGDMAQAANKASWFIITRWIAVIAVLVILIVTPLKERIVKYAECVRGSIGRFFTKIWNAIKDKIFWRKK
jgi:type IV secretory pathway component VirB8